jgi:alpha-tubulin suppressor-like RCC1 family protein
VFDGENGRLGTGKSKDEVAPTLVTTDWKAINIFAGSVHTCAIAESGQMYTWGQKNYTGHGTGEDVMEPKLLDRFDGKLMHSASIGPGGYHTIALTISGDVYTWGHNRVGQLGFENEETTDVTPEGAHFYKHPVFVRALSSRPVRQVAAGWGHSVVLCWDGSVLACGRNFRGQLGQDPSTCTLNERGHPYCAKFTQVQSLQGMKMERIACGGEHSAAIAEDGSLYIWGDDSCGQLAHQHPLSEVYFSDESRSHMNPHAYRVTGEPIVQGVVDIALGSSVSFVITAEDE